MKHISPIYFLLFFLCFLSVDRSMAAVISFENGMPAGWSTSKGSLSIHMEKVKLGKQALCWEWEAGAALTAANQPEITTTSATTNGGFGMWIYNTQTSDQSLSIRFLNNNGTQCSLSFKLNYTGWRYILAEYGNDMGLPKTAKGTLHTLQVIAPAKGSGKIYLDYLEFQEKVSWERMSNFQFTVKENAGIDSYLKARQALVLTPISPTAEQEESFKIISERLDNWYVGSNQYGADPNYRLRLNAIKSYLQRGVNSAPVILANGTVNGSGLFAHDYYGKKIDNIAANTFRNISESNLMQLAYDYRLNNNEQSLSKLLEIYDWYYDQGWAGGSALGTLRFEMLRSAGFHHSVMMVYDRLGERKQVIRDTEAWLSRFGDACQTPENPGELADYVRTLAMPKLFYALTLDQKEERTAALLAYKKYMDNAVAYAPGFLGSLKPDGSGYHHRGPYYSAYYPDVLYASCLAYYLLHDTPFALSDASFNNLKQALLHFRFFCGYYNVPGSTTGRFPAQTEVLQQLLPAFAYLINASEDTELINAYKRLWQPENTLVSSYLGRARTDICLSNTLGEAELMIKAATRPGVAEENPSGIRFMPFSGLLIARSPKWMFTIKGFSKFIWDYESTASENPFGRYQSYGQIEYHDLKQDLRSYQITKEDANGSTDWDWRLLSGTTTKYIPDEDLHYSSVNKLRNFSDQTFLGGIGMSENAGMFTARLHDKEIGVSFYADKSVFIAGNEILCLGSNITDQQTASFFATTLFQHKTTDRGVEVNGQTVTETISGLTRPVIKDNFGNYYLVTDGAVTIQKKESVWSAYIRHGKIITTPRTYAYTWLIQPTTEQVERCSQQSPWVILSQNTDAHAAYHPASSLLAASVFKAGKQVAIREIRQVNKPMLVMLQEKEDFFELALSNPDMDRPSATSNDNLTDAIVATPGAKSRISVELEGIFHPLLPDDHIQVQVLNGNTTIEVNDAHDGKTYYVRLKKEGTDINTLTQEGVTIIRNGNKIFIHDNANSAISGWELFSLNGKQIATGNQKEIDFDSYPAGMYVLTIQNRFKNNTFKIIR